MPIAWEVLSQEERAQAVLDDIDGLTETDFQELLQEFGEMENVDTDAERAMAELASRAQDRVFHKVGALTCKERARSRLQRRGVIE